MSISQPLSLALSLTHTHSLSLSLTHTDAHTRTHACTRKTTCVSTSTRNFPNRLGKGADVYLASAELAATAAVLGKLPNNDEYQSHVKAINTQAADVYRYLNFDQLPAYEEAAATVELSPEMMAAAKKMRGKML